MGAEKWGTMGGRDTRGVVVVVVVVVFHHVKKGMGPTG